MESKVANWNLETFIEEVKIMTHSVGQTFADPEDDWSPIMFILTDKGIVLIMIQTITDEFSKDLTFREILPELIRENEGRMAIFVCSAWTLEMPMKPEFEPPELEDIPLPSESPDRIEQLMLSAVAPGRTVLCAAKIYRDGEQPPVLSEWSIHGDDEAKLEGRIFDGMSAAIAEVNA
jgi:hypothetical protein